MVAQSGPKAPGIQDPLQHSSGSATKGAGKGAVANTISYRRAQEDPNFKVQAAQNWLQSAKEIFGGDSKEAEMAEQAVAAARQEAENRRTPQERAEEMREKRNSYIDAITKQVLRIRQLQQQRQAIDDELTAIDCQHKLEFENVATLDKQIEEYEMQAGLQKPIPTGGSLDMQAKERLKRRLQDIRPIAKEAIDATGVLDVPDKLREYDAAVEVLLGKVADLTAVDEIMSATDVAPSDDERDAEAHTEPPKAKTPRTQQPDTATHDAAMAEGGESQDGSWTEVLGPQAKKAQKLAAKSFQDIAKRLLIQPPTAAPSKGKASAKGGATKGKGKGPLAVVKQLPTIESNASQAPRPQAGADHAGPPLVPGVPFPPAGGTPPKVPAMSLSTGAASPAQASASGETAAPKASGAAGPQLSDEEWKEILANRGGRATKDSDSATPIAIAGGPSPQDEQ